MSSNCIDDNILYLLEDQTKILIYSFYKNTSKKNEVLNSMNIHELDIKNSNDKTILFEISKSKKDAIMNDIKDFEVEFNNILDIIYCFNEVCESSTDITFHQSKKTLEQTDFNKFTFYLKLLFNSLEYKKLQSIAKGLNGLIEHNIKNLGINLVNYVSVKIMNYWLLVNISFIEGDYLSLDNNLKSIKKEIENLEAYNLLLINQNSYNELSDNNENYYKIINQIPLLKSYLITWNLLKFKALEYNNNNNNNNNLNICTLIQLSEDYLSLCLSPSYINILKSLDHVIPYICFSYIIANTNKHRYFLLDLLNQFESNNDIDHKYSDLHNNYLIKLIKNCYYEFDIESLANIQKEAIKYCSNNYFLSNYSNLYGELTSKLIINLYIQLNFCINIKDISKLHINSNIDLKRMLKEIIIMNNLKVEIIKENDDEIIYNIKEEDIDYNLSSKASNLLNVSNSIAKFIEKV